MTRRAMEGPCEMAVGYEEPVRVLLCRRPGIERRDMPCIVAHPIVCDDCYTAWWERRNAARSV